MRFKTYLIAYILIIIFVVGCAPMTKIVVQLNRERYSPNINIKDYKIYAGKTIIFSSIIDESGTPNLWYYSPDKTVGYQLFYNSSSVINQPVASFFWYTLQKGFECAGLNIETSGSVYDAELRIIFTSLSDKEIQFDALGIKMGKLLFKKHCVVSAEAIETTDKAVLEKRAYGMIDSMIKEILDDPEFKKVFS